MRFNSGIVRAQSGNRDKVRIFIDRNMNMYFSLTSVLLDFSLTVKAATLIFISRWGLAISSAKEGKSGFIYNLVKS